jgi:hypothetical protein
MNGDQPKPEKETCIMKFVALALLGIGLAACNQTTGGPYASAVYVPQTGYGTVHRDQRNNCGPDIHVCFNERRDARDRGQQ